MLEHLRRRLRNTLEDHLESAKCQIKARVIKARVYLGLAHRARLFWGTDGCAVAAVVYSTVPRVGDEIYYEEGKLPVRVRKVVLEETLEPWIGWDFPTVMLIIERL